MFEKVTKQHVIQGIKDFEEKGYPNGFGPSSTYDLIRDGKRYPPKAIMAYANFHATGETPTNNFSGGPSHECFKALEREGFEIIDKEQHMDIVDVKKEFAEWLLKNAPESYKSMFLGYSVKSIEDKLNEINSYFKDIDLFLVDLSKVSGKIDEIKKRISRQGRSENPQFEKYDSSHGSGIPKAVLGKKNYFKFLEERYLNQETSQISLENLAIELNSLSIKRKFFNIVCMAFVINKDHHLSSSEAIELVRNVRMTIGMNNPGDSIRGRIAQDCQYFPDVRFYDSIQGFVDAVKERQVVKNYIDSFVRFPSKKSEIEFLIELLEKYVFTDSYIQEKDTRYWIFQGNPKVFDFEAAIADGSLDNFTVTAHRDKIKIGDKVILWITGQDAGCYALAEITSEPKKVSVLRDNKHWKVEDPNDIKAGIRITHNFYKSPVLWSRIKQRDEFSNFKGGNQGSNFSATVEEYNTILELAQANDNVPFFDYLKNFPEEDLQIYFSFLFTVINHFNLQKGDKRLQFSTKRNRLVLTIGQRYSWILFKNNKKGKFGVLSIDKIRSNSEQFSGNLPHPFFTHMDSVEFTEQEKDSIFRGFKQELDRTNKSGFRKHSNEEFEEAVFNDEFRSKYQKPGVMNLSKPKKPKNIILYGPPGTGKTYYLKNKLFDNYTSKQTSITREKYLETVVSECSWWQVIAIALLDFQRAKVGDIHHHEWVKVKESLSNSKTVRPTIWGQLQAHTIEECDYVNVTNRQTPQIFTKTEDSHWEIINELVDELAPELRELKDSVDNYQPDSNKEIKRYEFVTFHQSFAYEDFIEGIKPILPKEGEELKDLGYTIEPGVFQRLCKRAEIDQENRYAIFIDEINRGNVSAIFGELITLIELDKRKGAENELSITLPYSKEKFSVPSNVDIYGTMNTADRSVEALDTALRRRFEFKEMMPNLKLLKEKEVEGVRLSEMLKKINERIELLVDRDHTIGHSYLINVDSKIKLANAFKNKIIPLLQEYFYGDYGKIGLVLGEGFIEKNKNDAIQFADFEYENAEDFKTPTFKLRKVNSDTIIEAIQILLRADDGNKD
ncbi:AAA family ATPase [uncultured Winogradskyella sp.]|uniref:AAA family ATPase n=1 Tax=uncultured Winogradskyella sp. TaxID=395353 RepID=UPI00351618B6